MKARIIVIQGYGRGFLIESSHTILLPIFHPIKLKTLTAVLDAELFLHTVLEEEVEIDPKWERLVNTLEAVQEELDADAEEMSNRILYAKPISLIQ